MNGPEAVILAGGRGVRLRPLTTLIPKPLVPIGERHSILDVILEQLANAGFGHARIAVGHLRHVIKATIGDGERGGMRISYLEESEPLGTAGPLTTAEHLPDHFLVMNGDILCDMDYAAFASQHAESGALLTVAAVERLVRHEYGVIHVDDGKLTQFGEKPVDSFLVSTGIYGVSRSVFDRYLPGSFLGFDTVIHDLIADGVPPSVYTHRGLWFDVGRPDDYDEVNSRSDEILRKLLEVD
jgi:NDP-mannose synthase